MKQASTIRSDIKHAAIGEDVEFDLELFATLIKYITHDLPHVEVASCRIANRSDFLLRQMNEWRRFSKSQQVVRIFPHLVQDFILDADQLWHQLSVRILPTIATDGYWDLGSHRKVTRYLYFLVNLVEIINGVLHEPERLSIFSELLEYLCLDLIAASVEVLHIAYVSLAFVLVARSFWIILVLFCSLLDLCNAVKNLLLNLLKVEAAWARHLAKVASRIVISEP